MSTTIWNLDNAHLAGKVRFETWKKKHNERWYQPVREAEERMLGRVLLDNLPEPVREQLASLAPDAYKKISE